MQNVGLILLVFAFVFAMIAGCFAQNVRTFHMGWLAIAAWIAAELLGGLGRALH